MVMPFPKIGEDAHGDSSGECEWDSVSSLSMRRAAARIEKNAAEGRMETEARRC